MRIQHNITAMNAHRQLGINNTSVGKNLEKLSSGFRINRAGDDAAGLAISEKMRGQIRGLDMASNNAQDGISLIQTAEGNLQETHSILQRMRELAVQSSNGTFESANDRVNLDKEVQALKAEVDRIANSAHFNNTKLLDGNLATKIDTQATTDAAAKVINTTTVKNEKGSDAVAAEFTIKVGTTGTAFALGDFVSVVGNAASTLAGIKGATIQVDGVGVKLGDIFEITGGATPAAGSEIKFVAKAGGATHADVKDILMGTGAGGTGSVSANPVVGNNAGAGAAAKASSYKFEFDVTKIAGGQTFTLGEKGKPGAVTFEFSTNGSVTDPSNVIIDISTLDMTVIGADDAKGQWGAATAISAAIESAFGVAGTNTFNVDAKPAAAAALDAKYTLTMTAKDPGAAGNLGAIRVDDEIGVALPFLTGTQTVRGAEAGTAKPTVFATATLDINFGKLKAGDTFKIGNDTFEAISGKATVDTNATNKQFKIADTATDTANEAEAAANFISAFESAGAAATVGIGKAVYTDVASNGTGATMGKLTFTSSDATQDSAAFIAASLNNFEFKPIEDAKGATTKGGVVFQIGANGTADDRVNLTIEKQDTVTLGIGSINIKEIIDANDAITKITDATNKVSSTRADLGALQNRLEHTVANLGTTSENLTAAESRIRDVDMAKEMMEMTKNNILSQAAQAMLAQANQQPQGILQLLR